MTTKTYNTPVGLLIVKNYENSNCVLYKLCKVGTLHDVSGFEFGDKSEVRKLINLKPLVYSEYKTRRYGQPKLQKPKELKDVKQLCSVKFPIDGQAACLVFVKDKDVWIKHRDYFSRPFTKGSSLPINERLKKYFPNIKLKKERFIYTDEYSEIILRNEAWLKIENVVPIIQTKCLNYLQLATLMKEAQQTYFHTSEISRSWKEFFNLLSQKLLDCLTSIT